MNSPSKDSQLIPELKTDAIQTCIDWAITQSNYYTPNKLAICSKATLQLEALFNEISDLARTVRALESENAQLKIDKQKLWMKSDND
jgi:hypothetical protein